MLKKRIITTLLFDSDFMCVKPVAFGRPYRKLGTMRQYMNVIERRNIDELILLDITATEERRGPQFDRLSAILSNVFCPVCIGGGIASIDDISVLLACGADKVAIRTNYHLVYEASRKFGNQAIVGVIDYPDYNVAEIGVGELLVTSIQEDGTMKGYNLPLTEDIAQLVDVPVIANGGCGSPEHMLAAFEVGADAVAAGSMFLYTDQTPRSCAQYLADHGVAVRI